MTSGEVLRETRERKGYDISTVARRLRVRPDILRAIEAGDFPNMPSRGYSRNIIYGYARFLGLNSSEIVKMYLDEAYAYQVQRARRSNSIENDNNLRTERRNRDRALSSYQRRNPQSRDLKDSSYGDGLSNYDYSLRETNRIPNSHNATNRTSRNRTSVSNRRLYDDRTQYSRDDYGISRNKSTMRASRSRDFNSNHSSYRENANKFYDDFQQNNLNGIRRSSSRRPLQQQKAGKRSNSRSRINVNRAGMSYSSERFPYNLGSKIPLILVAIAIILVIILIASFILRGASHSNSSDVSTLPISGISDTTGSSDSNSDDEVSVEVAPTSAHIVYSVAEGNEVYLEIYDNSTSPTAEILDGPIEKSVETTATWTITTFTPDLISLTVNGDKVELTPNDEFGGMYAYTVDFPTILENWRQTHTSKSSQRQSAVSSATNAINESSSSGSSSSESSSSTTSTTNTTETTSTTDASNT